MKITERCNINCTYCYIFNKGDESYKSNPPLIKEETILALKKFLLDSIINHGVTDIQIDFHGGEPLMLGKFRFDKYLKILSEINKNEGVKIKFAIQTNGILVDSEWIKIFEKYSISVGISIDGPKHINDRNRIDFNGRGTYEKTMLGFYLLKKAYEEKLIPHFGILSVSSPDLAGSELYDHFVNELCVSNFDILFPIDSHDSFDIKSIEGYKKYYNKLFKLWVAGDVKAVNIRLFDRIALQIVSGASYVSGSSKARNGGHLIITVSSSGAIGPDDSLKTIRGNHFKEISVFNSNYSDLIESNFFNVILEAENTIPQSCQDCSWKQLCRGGATGGRLINRYSSVSGFNNSSVMCEVLDDLYSEMSAYLLENGISFEDLQNSLFTECINWLEYDQEKVRREVAL